MDDAAARINDNTIPNSGHHGAQDSIGGGVLPSAFSKSITASLP
jgi:hypothetical protein